MTSIFSGANVSGVESALEGLVPQFSGLSQEAAALSPMFTQQGSQDIYPTALSQYTAGATGVLTPDEQAAVNQTKSQMDLQTGGNYANLGLGGSTMKTQDLNANAQKSLAQQKSFNVQDETLGLSGLTDALNYETQGVNTLGTAGQILGGASGALNSAGTLAAGQQAAQMQALGGIGSALGSKL